MLKRGQSFSIICSVLISLLSSVPLSAGTNTNDEKLKNLLHLFGQVVIRIRADYIVVPSDVKLISDAIDGMLKGLDSHSHFISKEKLKDMQTQTRAEFDGIGIELTIERGDVKVLTPIKGRPAAKAGVLSGDLITHVDGKAVFGLSLNEVVANLRGTVDKPITLTIIRKNDKPFNLTFNRERIILNPIKSKIFKDVGYLKIDVLNDQTSRSLSETVAAIKMKIGRSIRGFIIDLRNCPGGLLDQAIDVSDSFLEKGAIVLTRGRGIEETQRSNARSIDIAVGIPLVVLINGGTAAGAEIIAGALKDHRRATLIGTQTYGQGTVQTTVLIGSLGAIKLTTARFYTPSNRSIEGKGIDPDIVVEQRKRRGMIDEQKAGIDKGEKALREFLAPKRKIEQYRHLYFIPKEERDDKQLQYALKHLRREIGTVNR